MSAVVPSIERADGEADRPLARFVQRHERKLIVVWLGGCVLLLAGLAYWSVLSRGAERAVAAWDARWVGRLDAAQALVEAQRFDEAALSLERLDADFPAHFIKHHLDRQRERLLSLLGTSYLELDRKGKAIATFERLAAFDPKNFDNHFQLGEALRHFTDDGAARAAYEQVLAIHPTHLPTVLAELKLAWAGSLYAQIVDDYERYLDAWLLARVRVSFGEHVLELDAHVDGRAQRIEGALAVPAGWSGPVCLETRGFSARLSSFEVVPPLRAGVVELLDVVTLGDDAPWIASAGELRDGVQLSAASRDSRICVERLSLPHGASRVRLELTLYKALPADMWQQVAKSYSNRLEHAKWRAAEQRSLVGGCLEAGTLFDD